MTQLLHRTDTQSPAGARHRNPSAWTALAALALVATSACGTTETEPTVTVEPRFKEAFPGTNGRSCASCHVPEDGFTLTPAYVARLLETNPNDPLFNAIDADDPTADPLTFEHLKKGLVRVWLTLPDNMDLIDDGGNVITPSNRKLFVWRGVPSIADSALTAPYQLDGRVETLEQQAQAAISGHSEGGEVNKAELERIAAFERSVFSSDRARKVADELASGVEPGESERRRRLAGTVAQRRARQGRVRSDMFGLSRGSQQGDHRGSGHSRFGLPRHQVRTSYGGRTQRSPISERSSPPPTPPSRPIGWARSSARPTRETCGCS
jgi:Di-haem cytochrome c peroxidase